MRYVAPATIAVDAESEFEALVLSRAICLRADEDHRGDVALDDGTCPFVEDENEPDAVGP